jgi:DNA polymerase-3 subunit alpha
VHTEYSLLDGAARVKALLARAEKLGQSHVAVTDHGNMYAAWELYHAAQGTGVTPIIGLEAYVAPESRFHKMAVKWGQARTEGDAVEGGKDISGGGKYLHMTSWAQDATGLRNLFAMQSQAFLTGQYGKPRIDLELMAEHAAGVMVSTGCPSGGVQTRLRLGQFDKAVAYAGTLKEIFGAGNVFCELMDHGLGIERDVRDGLMQVAKQVGLPFLVTNDSHYVERDDAPDHDSLLAVNVGKNLDDPTRFRFDGDGYYLKTAAEMRGIDSSEAWAQGCDNTLLLAERVSADAYAPVYASRDLSPEFPVPAGETQVSWLRKEVERGLRFRFGPEPSAEVVERTEYELKLIEEMGFPAYFLVVADLCDYARRNKIMVGPGRGSATGSMVAYVLQITELDPIRHGLIFERFLNPERVSMPDIDLDFDDRGRDQMIQYTFGKYGSDRVAQIITFGRIKAKAALKDATRILGLPYGLGEKLTKAFPPDRNGRSAGLACIDDPSAPQYAEAGRIRDLMAADPSAGKVLEVAHGLEGLIRSTGVHAAGVIICSEPLINVVPLSYREKDGTVIVGVQFAEAEELGLLKMDFLGLRNLSIIKDAIESIKSNRGVEVNLADLDEFDDVKTFELLARGDTLGVFQLDGSGMRALLRLLKPTRFVDIAAAVALYRPGPMAANAHTNYALRQNGQQEHTPIHPEVAEPLRDILGPTHQLVVFQEQVMQIPAVMAGYSLAEADNLRRAMGKKKKEILQKAEPDFLSRSVANGYSQEAAQAVWDVIMPFSEYAFNKSHSAGYAYIAYWTAWLKTNYPTEFMAALLTSVGDDRDRMALCLAEARHMGVQVLPPDINDSGMSFTAVGDAVRFGLGAISGLGEKVIAGLLAARDKHGRFATFLDYLNTVPATACNKKALEALIRAGAFDGLGHTRAGLMLGYEQAAKAANGVKKQKAKGQIDLFSELMDESEALEFGLDLHLSAPEWDTPLLLAAERDVLGLYVSGHPLDNVLPFLKSQRTHTVAEVLAEPGGKVTVCGLVSAIERRVSQAGNAWTKIALEDEGATMEICFFSKANKLLPEGLKRDDIVQITGKVQKRDDSVAIMGDALYVLEVPDGGMEPVTLWMREAQATSWLLDELRAALKAHPGDTPVQLQVMVSDVKGYLVELPDYEVRVDRGFQADIKALLGDSAILPR